MSIPVYFIIFEIYDKNTFMKQIAFYLLLSLFSFSIDAQEMITTNLGGTHQKGYYTAIPYEKVNGVLIIPVEIDGTVYRFMLDTGAVTCISQEIVDKIKPQTLLEKLSITDNWAKEDSLPVYNLSEILVGGVLFNDIPTVLLNESQIKTCFNIDGVVGSNLLRNSIVRFSTLDSTIIITDQPKKLDLRSKKKYSIEMFLTPYQSTPFIWTTLKDKDKARVQLMFDSGMTDMYDLSLNHLNLFMEHDIFSEELSVAQGSLSFGFFGKNDDTLQYRLRVHEVDICNPALKNVSIYTTPASNSRMGLELLEHGTVTVDFMNKRFYFEPNFKKEKDLYSRMMPFSLSMEDSKLIIGTIWDKELKNKINVGDIVLSINETNFENMSECEIFIHDIYDDNDSYPFRLRAKDGTEKKILIEKN